MPAGSFGNVRRTFSFAGALLPSGGAEPRFRDVPGLLREVSLSIRRSLAVAGAVALASSIVLGGAQGALAVGAAASPSASAGAADKAAQQVIDLSLNGVPSEFFAGGDAREFNYVIDNATAHDFALYPLLRLKSDDSELPVEDFKVQFQLPGATTWDDGTIVPSDDGEDDAPLILLGNDTVNETSVVEVKRNTSATIKVRVSFEGSAPLGHAGVLPLAFFLQLDDLTGEQIGHGDFSYDRLDGVGYFIRKFKASASPSPSATATATPTKAPSASASPSATVKPSETATATPSETAKPSETATATPSETVKPSETATAKPSETATAAPSGSASPTAKTSPSATATASTSTAPAPAASSSTSAAQTPVVFPATPPAAKLPAITPAVLAKAKVISDAAAPAKGKDLAQTGGGSDSTPIAIGGAAVLAAGVGTLVVLRRRKSAQHG